MRGLELCNLTPSIIVHCFIMDTNCDEDLPFDKVNQPSDYSLTPVVPITAFPSVTITQSEQKGTAPCSSGGVPEYSVLTEKGKSHTERLVNETPPYLNLQVEGKDSDATPVYLEFLPLENKDPIYLKSNCDTQLTDVESRYNYQQYTNFVHSLQTPRMASTLDDFEVIGTIGTGSYGTCKKIRRKKDGKVMVWKEMDYGAMSDAEKQLLVSEVNLLRELKHKHIVRYYDRIIDRTHAVIYILMEYCQGGDLATLISRCRKEGTLVEEDFAWRILIQTTLALKECHRRKNGKAILHRDLKPANIFLDKHQSVKLGDFGLARVLHHDTSFAQTYVGTPYYMSPELVNNMSYNEKSDIWALGCLLYEMCSLHPPFTASNQTELNRKIRIGDFARLPSKYSSELDKIIRKMIRVEVSQRPSIDEILLDPVVSHHYHHLGHSQAQQVQSSGSTEGTSHGSNTNNCNDTNSSDRGEVAEQNRRVQNLEEEFKTKWKQLELKEKELESREHSVTLREKLAEEKLKRAMNLLEHYRRRSDSLSSDRRLYSELSSPRDVVPLDLDSSDSPQSCLSKGVKDPESPKKRVSFDIYGKENLRQKAKMADYQTNVTYKYDTYSGQLGKAQCLRLLSAKDGLLDLQRIGLDTRYNKRNLLYFR